MIKIPKPLLREIYAHTESSYPNECCGVMIGTTDAQSNHTIQAFRPCKNLNQERARDRYLLDPLDYLRAEREFDSTPWEIIGIYHSHPDHPSRPSKTDTDAAFVGYSYVIISVRNGKVDSAQSWVLNETDGEKVFHEEPLLTDGDSK
jgi:proteasome lid subunit RPN8/RPN11